MKQNLTLKKMRLEDNSVVIKKFFKGIEGGRTLDVAGYTDEVILAGHVIIEVGGTYKPMPVKNGAYDEFPEGAKYVGVLYSSIETEKPAAAIMTWGVVNSEALPYAVPEGFKTACPHIDFQKDEEA